MSENTLAVPTEGTLAVPELHSRSYSWEKRMDVVAKYMLLGNMRAVSEQTGVNYATLMDWKKSDWWPDMVDQIRRQKKTKTRKTWDCQLKDVEIVHT